MQNDREWTWMTFNANVKDNAQVRQGLTELQTRFAAKRTAQNGTSVYYATRRIPLEEACASLGDYCVVTTDAPVKQPPAHERKPIKRTEIVKAQAKPVKTEPVKTEQVLDKIDAGNPINLERMVKEIKPELKLRTLPQLRDALHREMNGQARRNLISNIQTEISSRKTEPKAQTPAKTEPVKTEAQPKPVKIEEVVKTEPKRDEVLAKMAIALRAMADVLDSLK
jgi:hypothetical protein